MTTLDRRKWTRRTIARLISEVENDTQKARRIINAILPYSGNAHIIGITGPPGCGKSTLIEKLALHIRKNGKKVGIIAVDPTSKYSGGAFLGNRIRMQEASKDRGIFIRSMASRSSIGGVSRATFDAIKIMDVAGFDYIIIETVGAGQVQTDIARTVHTVVVVLQPQTGDMIQAMKAGLMEIGDIYVVNKRDLQGADKTIRDLREILGTRKNVKWRPRIAKTNAVKGNGIPELGRFLEEHRLHLVSTGELLGRQKEIARSEVEQLIEEILKESTRKLLEELETDGVLREIAGGKISAHNVVTDLMTVKDKKALDSSL